MKTAATPIVHKQGHWVEKPRVSEILLCVCGNKYIKTRKAQEVCVKCLVTVTTKK